VQEYYLFISSLAGLRYVAAPTAGRPRRARATPRLACSTGSPDQHHRMTLFFVSSGFVHGSTMRNVFRLKAIPRAVPALATARFARLSLIYASWPWATWPRKAATCMPRSVVRIPKAQFLALDRKILVPGIPLIQYLWSIGVELFYLPFPAFCLLPNHLKRAGTMVSAGHGQRAYSRSRFGSFLVWREFLHTGCFVAMLYLKLVAVPHRIRVAFVLFWFSIAGLASRVVFSTEALDLSFLNRISGSSRRSRISDAQGAVELTLRFILFAAIVTDVARVTTRLARSDSEKRLA
jgi:hypothetical protein